jgi:hypothetical protein
MESTSIKSCVPLRKVWPIQPLITKLTLDHQLFVKNSYADFQDNLTDGLVAATRPLTNEQAGDCGLHIRCSLFLLHKEH